MRKICLLFFSTDFAVDGNKRTSVALVCVCGRCSYEFRCGAKPTWIYYIVLCHLALISPFDLHTYSHTKYSGAIKWRTLNSSHVLLLFWLEPRRRGNEENNSNENCVFCHFSVLLQLSLTQPSHPLFFGFCCSQETQKYITFPLALTLCCWLYRFCYFFFGDFLKTKRFTVLSLRATLCSLFMIKHSVLQIKDGIEKFPSFLNIAD